jgi:hypothetical protein
MSNTERDRKLFSKFLQNTLVLIKKYGIDPISFAEHAWDDREGNAILREGTRMNGTGDIA